ncbi:hypothetical protein CRG98_046571 [Punica granatum]|uniref:Uncharacterized protein n=1 Tax=Punica granatum TaxID=22663 RepID=A0A2I0HMT4_PUNGR|nr:hypothetical protein CRG98_046571 [Punica granatum]
MRKCIGPKIVSRSNGDFRRSRRQSHMMNTWKIGGGPHAFLNASSDMVSSYLREKRRARHPPPLCTHGYQKPSESLSLPS